VSGYTIDYDHRHGTVDVTLSGVTILGMESSIGSDGGNDSVTVGMPLADFTAMVTVANEPQTRELRRERDEAREQAALWKSLAERQDNTAPLRRELRTVERDRDFWRSKFEGAQANAEYVRAEYGHPDEIEELKATVVRQAREITRLTGEGE
jgi:hypothetical protein